MKITDIKSYPIWYGPRNLMLVKVETDAGIYGWGEAGLSSRELAVVGRGQALSRVADRQGPDEAGRAVARDVPQPVL